MIEEKSLNNKTKKNEYLKHSSKDKYTKIKIKRKNVDKKQENQYEKSRNIKKGKHNYENSDKIPLEKLNLLLSDKKRTNQVKYLENNLYKSTNNINNSNDKSINNGCSSSIDKKQKLYNNQRETPFLRKYILKLYRDESIHKEGNRDNQFYLKYYSNNHSLSKCNNKEYYDYEYDHTIKNSHVETEVKEPNNKFKNEFFNGESIENDKRRRINQQLNVIKKYSNKKEENYNINYNTLKEKKIHKRNNKFDKYKRKSKSKNINDYIQKEIKKTINHIKKISDLQNNYLTSNGVDKNNQVKKKLLRINLSPIGSPNSDNKIDGYFSDNEFYKPKMSLPISNHKPNLTSLDNKDISHNLINDIFKRSYINNNSNIVCLLCNKIARKPLMCPKCDKMFCEECIRNKKVKNKFCHFCNYYISNIYNYIHASFSNKDNDNSSTKRYYKDTRNISSSKKQKYRQSKDYNNITYKGNKYQNENKNLNNIKKNLNIEIEQMNLKTNDNKAKFNHTLGTDFNINPRKKKNSVIKISENLNTINNISKNRTFKDKPKKNVPIGSTITNILSKIKSIKNEKIGVNSSTKDNSNSNKNQKQTQIILNKIKNINSVNNNIFSRNNNEEKIIFNPDDNINFRNSLPLFNFNEAGSIGSIKTIVTNTENDINDYKEVIKEFNNASNKKNNIKSKIYGNRKKNNKNFKKEEYQNKLKTYKNHIDKDKDDLFVEKIKEENNTENNEDENDEHFCTNHCKEKITYFCLECNLKYCEECIKEINHNKEHQMIKYPNENNKNLQKAINEYMLNHKNKIINNNDILYNEQKIILYEKEKKIFMEQLDIIKNNYINKINTKIQDIKNIIDKFKEKQKDINKYDSLLKKYFERYMKGNKENEKENILNEININNKYNNDQNFESEKSLIEVSTINTLFQCISSQYIFSNINNIKEKRTDALYTEIKFDKFDLNKFLKNIQINNYLYENKYSNLNDKENKEENIDEIISEKELYIDENLLALTEASFYIKNINDDVLLQLNINLFKNEDNFDNNIDVKKIVGYFLICQEENNTFELTYKKIINGILTMYKVIPYNYISTYDNIKYKIILYNNN